MLPYPSFEEPTSIYELIDLCWQGRIGEREALPLVQKITQSCNKESLQSMIAMLLNQTTQHGREALMQSCCHHKQ